MALSNINTIKPGLRCKQIDVLTLLSTEDEKTNQTSDLSQSYYSVKYWLYGFIPVTVRFPQKPAITL